MNDASAWQPDANVHAARERAETLALLRQFMAERNVLEVETPTLCQYTVSDLHTASLTVALQSQQIWLRTSPEYHMKRLLAAGYPDIYQIAKVFRAEDTGSRHYPEFTMLEWYRLNFDLQALSDECCDLINATLSRLSKRSLPRQRLSYREAFQNILKLDPFTDSVATLIKAARGIKGWRPELAEHLGEQRSGWLDLLAGDLVFPALARDTLWVINDYPAEQAMLAKLKPGAPEVAERFEILCNGLELANGFHELRDAAEQRARFTSDNRLREQASLPLIDADPYLLSALEHELPDCSGVALGLDRLLMLGGGHSTISATVSFRPGS